MPLVKIEEINANRAIALWVISESVEELIEQRALNEYDKSLFAQLTHEQKQKEWLSGRLIIKHLAEYMDISFKGVTKDNNGKPNLTDSTSEISLSHSFPYVAAIIDRSEEVGIDLEQPKEKLRRIAPRFLNDSELDFIKNDLEKLCICWCAKETLYKIYSERGIAFRENMCIDAFELNQENTFTGNILVNGNSKKYKLKYRIAKDHILTFNI